MTELPLEEVVPPGVVVGGYRIERKLGSGGQGKVYLAWREGRAYALKFIHLEHVGEWGWRELFILLRHQWPNVVRLRSHLRWPEDTPEYLVLVMEYVPGRTVNRWAAEDNPCAREVARLLLKLARALGQVHEAGVLHRDLKDDNVLVRAADGEPVLVDFAAGSMPGTPRVTRGALAPADLRFRSPESVAFFLRPNRRPEEHYRYSATDDLYALGVLLYALLTDTYPIDDVEPLMLADILSRQPLPPHEMNERVPRVLSDVCMRLLEKEPGARWASTGALCTALEAALKQAEGDAAWDVPLCLGWQEEDDAPEAPGPRRVPLPSWADRWARQKPRRGKRPVAVEPPTPPRPPVEAVPLPASGPTLVSSHPRRADVLAALGKAAALVALLVLVGLGAERLVQRPARAPSPPQASGGEMARGDKPPEAAGAAASPQADTTPAAKDDASVKTPRKTPSPDNKPRGRALRAACAGLAGKALQACVAAQQTAAPVHPAPPALECPADAVRTMEDTLGIPITTRGDVHFPPDRGGAGKRDVRQSVTVQLGVDWDYLGKKRLDQNTVLSGRLFFTTDRIYGLFTEARTADGTTYPVCLELVERGSRLAERGVKREDPGGPADSAVIYSPKELRAVRRFDTVSDSR